MGHKAEQKCQETGNLLSLDEFIESENLGSPSIYAKHRVIADSLFFKSS